MRILALDIGGLTQDILLFDTTQTVENCVKLIMPSPTIVLARRIREATAARQPIFFTGVNMGGGPSKRALMNHLNSGLKAYSTAEAAATFDDNIEALVEWGVKIVSQDNRPQETTAIETRDLDLAAVKTALKAFNVDPTFDAVAVAVLDHGVAPPDVSDRLFRFDHLRHTLTTNRDIFTFAYLANEIPPHLTRMKAVAETTDQELPLLVMDTPVVAAIGAAEDREVSRHEHRVIVNVGNFHTMAFHLRGDTIMGLFEHHTGKLNRSGIDDLITRLVSGELTHEEVYENEGHGSLVFEKSRQMPFVAVTGPRRKVMTDSRLSPHFAAPYGDMMLTGCFGLVRAFARRLPEWGKEIERPLESSR